MIFDIFGTVIELEELPTEIFGLSFHPQMKNFDNNRDWESFTVWHTREVTEGNFNLVDHVSKGFMSHGIIEIGVNRNGEHSFTQALLKNKPDSIPYLGIDIDDKSFLNNPEKRIFTLQANSFDQARNREYLRSIGMEKVSLLFIDGDHSVNAVVNDWRYADLLSANGVVMLHDTVSHPGPRVILEAIDKGIFRVEKHFPNEDDYGLAIAYRI
jgi:cephalosporin hydroxylase